MTASSAADVPRASFEFTHDEFLAVTLRVVHGTEQVAGARRRFRRTNAVGVALTVAFVAFLKETPTPAYAGVMAGAGLVLGGVWYAVSGRLFDVIVRFRARREVTRQLAGASVPVCEVELRPDVLWWRQPGMEAAWPWSAEAAITEEGPDIVFTFAPGLIIVRGRAFATPADRERFLGRARALVEAARPSTVP